MVGILNKKALQDRARLDLLGIRFIRGIGSRGEGERVENRGFCVLRVSCMHCGHRAFIRQNTGPLIDVRDVAIEMRDGLYVGMFTLSLRRRSPRLLNRFVSSLQLFRRLAPSSKWIAPVAKRDSPVRH